MLVKKYRDNLDKNSHFVHDQFSREVVAKREKVYT